MNAFYAEDVKDEVNHEVEKVVAPKAMIKKSYKKEQKTDTFRLSRFMNNTGRREKVAIIGISGRFPGARDVNEFWNILLEGKEVIGEVPRDRQSWWQQEDIAREARVGAIPGVAEFDPLFFEISPVDAEEIDPRQRLLLEETWKALEDAGYDKKAFENEKIGIFVGVEDGDYRLLAGTDSSITSNHNAVLAARLSYFLNLKGPNMAINTACSSGLVAFHQACLSLQNDECDTAIVAAANLMTTPEGYKGMKAAGMLGKDGKCYAFDKRANGMIPSEAIAVIILKKGSKAQLDGNHIYATVAGSGVNYDGKTNGITAPSGQSQTRLLKEVYEKAHINPEDISYIVTHGTGTKLGDPMEINALADAFKEYQTSKAHCAITSNKPNIGHALAASGLVSLISLIMAFKTKTIPASINCEQVNDYIHWEESPFYINRANKVWKGEDGKKRLAGVSAFGMSGTNAHVVLESYDKASHAVPELSYVMLVLSAKTKEALKQRIEDLIAWLEKEDIQLERVSYTLMAGRMHFNHRLAVVVKNRQEAIEVLKKAIDSESVPNVFKGTVQRGIVTLDTVKESMLQMIEANNRLDVDAYQKILCTLSENYCKGYEVPYEKLFNGIQEKVSLPTYPFARETYWVEAKETNLGVRQLHPFIHENVSNLSQQCFKTTLMSKEQLMQSIYLEMARKALMLSKEEQDKVLVLEHITFPERLDTNEEACELYTRIYESGRSLNWEISKDKQLTRDETVYCTGKAVYRRNEALEKADLEAQVNDCQKMALTIPKIHSTWTSDGANQVIVEFEQENNLDIIISPQIIVGGLKALQEIHHKKWHVVDIKKINKIEILSLSPSKWGILTINNQEAELTVDMKLYDEAGNMTLHIYDLQCGDVMQLQEVATPKKRRMKKQVTGKGRCLEMKGFTIEQCIIWEIKNMITKMLKIPTEKLDLDESLSEFGFDSISLLKFADHINERYEINITPDTFYTYPTIERLKDYLYKQYTDKMQEFYQDEFVIVEEEKEIMPQKDKKTLRRSVQPQEEIAIVGMSGRFPDAWNVDELWTILSQGKEVIHDIDKSRKEWWQAPIVSRNVGAIPGIDEFDALFFGISPREAENMDPRQRILLEEMWKALEDAGYGEKALKNEKIGIFAGIEESDYRVLVGKNANITANHNGVLAARLAYFLNLKGPNMAINTACSSGLVALHEACLSLRNGECDTAIVAAANIMSTPESYDAMKEAGMLSKSGKCYAFDKRADGMIPAEAIAVVVLKRLSYAKENHHPIYASIVADGINYDGKTNGITAPSGQAQIELLKDTYEKFDINPQDISYMVTHGTGTKLGDPIEINALSEVFKAYNMPNKCCALTSTKPNIGHALAASGVVSLISLVMALNKEAIPASINCEQVNDYIHWEESPFYINQKLKPWSDTNGVKRLGAVSAFGMSGTNVHVVVESYHDVKEVCEPKSNYLLVFSAKTEDSLYNNISNMITTFERNKTLDLSEVSYTLLTGRMSFNHRCSVVVRDIDEAINVLKQVHSGKKLPNLFEGVVPRDFVGHAFIQEAIENVLKQIDSVENDSMKYQSALTALAEFYCMGYNVPSEALFKNDTPQLINLPTYAFEREHYWAEESCSKVHSNDTQASVLHPLVHSNTSEFTMQRFSSIFTGNESCFEDGFMKELAYIEMVQVGMALSLGEQRSTMEIRNIVWNDKLSSQVSDVHIGFGLDEAQEMYFKVYAQDNVENPNSIGYVNATEVATIEQVELNEIIKAYPESLKVDKVYAGIEEILQGQEGLMVKLKDSLSTNVYRADAIINVDILESCLSAIKIAYGIENASIKLKTATEMSIKINECITWAILTVAQEEQAGKTVFVVDADLCDRDGNVTAYIEELVFEIEGFKKVESPKEVKGAEAIYETMAFKEDWEEKTLEMVEKEIRNIVVYADIAHWSEITQYIKAQNEATRLILITQGEAYAQEDANKYSINKDKLEDHIQVLSRIKEAVGELDNILYLWAKENEAEARSQTSIVYILQAIHQTATSVKQVTLVGGDEDELIQCYEESWMGITFSTKLVLPKVKIHTAYIKASDMNKYLPVVWQELFAEKIENVYYENNIRKVLKKQEVKLEDKSESMFKNDGIYLLTGGLGGLGMIFSMHLAETYDANLILVGRSKQEKYQDRIDRIKKAGANVLYVQADVCNLEQMQQAVQKGVEAFGKINGVIHAAGLPGKGNILEKDIKEYYATMAPKIQGTLVLTKACQEQQLDFICYFSSSSAIIGDFGNCDYAVGNRFLMSYARYYNSKVGKEGYTGKAVVVNWPLWKSEGMGFQDEQGSKMYLKSSGQKFMEAAEGIPLLEKLLVQTRLQHLILIGERDRVYRFLQLEKKGVDEVIIAETKKTIKKPGKGRKREMKGWSVSQCITWDLKEAISKLLKLPISKIEVNENLADFGFDSMTLEEFSDILSKKYQLVINPDVFYRYPTIEKLCEYLNNEYHKVLEEYYQEEEKKVVTVNKKEQPIAHTVYEAKKVERSIPEKQFIAPSQVEIAVVGMSGRFPDSRNVEELWAILSEGKDVVHNVSKERTQWWEDNKDRKIGSIPGVAEFDSLFFEISPREAETMDPRQRLLLQETWKALEDAGYGERLLKEEKIGMFVGVEEGDYKALVGTEGSITSNHNGVLAARLAYFLNLDGPNMAINTACSSGLVAVHEACLSLRSGECDTAIVAAANIMALATTYDCMDQVGMLGKDGKCYAFDKRAEGMIPAEAVAVIVLKRLDKAKQDGNPIYGTIVGSGINYDGRTNGITAPSGEAQVKLLKDVYKRFNVNPEDMSYIVTHGTGTKLGDPIEINALAEVFKGYVAHKKNYCALTSTKPNIGHALAASGVVSLISLLLAMKYETIPQSIHCEQPNDYIDWEQSPFYLNRKNKVWKDEANKARLAAVSAFGMSGTNAHVVVKSYRDEACKCINEMPAYLFAFSARNTEILQECIHNMRVMLEESKEELNLAQISYTLLNGRKHFNERCVVVVRSREEAVWVLRQAEESVKVQNIFRGSVSRDFTVQTTMQRIIKELIRESHECVNDEQLYFDKICALAEFYCLGHEIPAKELFGEQLNMVSLPTYPFAKKKHWVGMRTKNKPAITNKPVVESEPVRTPKPVVAPKSVATKPVSEKTVTPQMSEKVPMQARENKIVLRDLSEYLNNETYVPDEVRELITLEPLGGEALNHSVQAESKKPIAPQKRSEVQKGVEVSELLQDLTVSLAKELYVDIEEIESDKSFTELGLDSIIGVEWIREINKKYGLNISSTRIYQYPNLLEFTKYIAQSLNKVSNVAGQIESVSQVTQNVRKEEKVTPKAIEEEHPSINMDEIIVDLASSLAEELYIDLEDIDYEKSFMELGLDSIIGVEWVKHINKKYGVNINSTRIYEYPNLIEFAKYIASNIKKTEVSNVQEVKSVKPSKTKTSVNMEEILSDLANSLAQELYVDVEEIDYGTGFTELGLDSIIGVEWIRGINKKYKTNISTTKIYQYSNLSEFAKYIVSILGDVQEEKAEKEIEQKEDIDIDQLLWQVYEGDAEVSDTEKLISDYQRGNEKWN
nr:SDR family NAD(P)-dependent oxidoreductase [Cellulosilyticum ruminicola]